MPDERLSQHEANARSITLAAKRIRQVETVAFRTRDGGDRSADRLPSHARPVSAAGRNRRPPPSR
ncbi:hypothetical protein NSERUTF1_2230 [Nocardia seriolae]|nr:hypothetical protein NSERUTF1_2230 [Nocardia seriolae]